MPVLRRKGSGTGSKTDVKSIRRKGYLGGNVEGKVHKVRVTVKRKGKKREITLAEKRFYEKRDPADSINLKNPVRQFETMQELQRLNRRKKLGLRIVPTIRLREETGKKPTLVLTKLTLLKKENLPETQESEFFRDASRQQEKSRENGYFLHGDCFEPMIDKETGKVVAIIADFGNVRKMQESRH